MCKDPHDRSGFFFLFGCLGHLSFGEAVAWWGGGLIAGLILFGLLAITLS